MTTATEPRRLRPLGNPGRPPTRGTCRMRLTLKIPRKGEVVVTSYDVRVTPAATGQHRTVRLHKLGRDGRRTGVAYDVTMTEHGPHCDCPDFTITRDGLDPAGCKHTRALAAQGLL